MKRIVAGALPILVCAGAAAAAVPDLPKGISTWTYAYSDGIAKKVGEFNATALPHLKFRYLFPYAGSVSFAATPDLEGVFGAGRNLPEPATTGTIDGFATPENWGDGYFSRIRGYIHPPKTGEYTFWLASDDDGRLFLSTGKSEKDKRLIASVAGWADPGEWDKLETQKSGTILLKAGSRYYVEAWHMEGGGADHLSVAWSGPGFERTVIGREHVSPPANPPQKGSLLIERWLAKDVASENRARFQFGYGTETVKSYAGSLPAGTMLLPIVDGRNPDKAFDDWTDDEYRKAARKVADGILSDPDAAGVHIDVEPFRASHIPFYSHLRRFLNAEGKLTSMFVGFVNDETMTQVFESCDIVVLSGYDLGCENRFECYVNGMTNALKRVQRIAEATNGHYLVGIPAQASWGEYEYTAGVGCEKKDTGIRQEDYVGVATGLVCQYMKKPQCLGVSLWVMSDPATVEDPAVGDCRAGRGGWRSVDGCCKFPNVIRESVWGILANYCP